MQYRNTHKGGFTLIEILIVVVIVGILSGVSFLSVARSRLVSRDAVRVADLSIIQSSLGLYFADNKKYPATISALLPIYLSQIPADPKDGSAYKYAGIDTNSSVGTCESYHLGAVLENDGSTSLGQDRDANVPGSVCTGSSADFYGVSTDCGVLTSNPDLCFDLAP